MSLGKWLARVANPREYVTAVAGAIADGQVSPDELHDLVITETKLGLDVEAARSQRLSAVETYIDQLTVDGQFSDQDQARVHQVMAVLGLSVANLKTPTRQKLHVLWTLNQMAKGVLPRVDPANITLNLQPGEVAHFATTAHVYETREVGQKFSASDWGTSYGVGRNSVFHSGVSDGTLRPIYGEVCIATGELILTSHRAVYLANERGFNHAWADVAGMEAYTDASEWHLAGRAQSTVLFYEDPSVAPVVGSLVNELVNR